MNTRVKSFNDKFYTAKGVKKLGYQSHKFPVSGIIITLHINEDWPVIETLGMYQDSSGWAAIELRTGLAITKDATSKRACIKNIRERLTHFGYDLYNKNKALYPDVETLPS